MDNTKQPSSTKEQRIRYLKALLKKADQNLRIRDQENLKGSESDPPDYCNPDAKKDSR